MLPTEARVGHLATIRARHLHAYMSLGHVPGPCNCSCPPPCSASLPFVRSRTVVPCLVPQVGVSRVSGELGLTCSQGPPMPSCFCRMIQHEWIHTSRLQALTVVPSTFDLTNRLETRQQTLVLLVSNCCCSVHVVVSRILHSLEFDG